jgi:hypothetical protein
MPSCVVSAPPQNLAGAVSHETRDLMEDELGPTTQILKLPFGEPIKVLLVDDDDLVVA